MDPSQPRFGGPTRRRSFTPAQKLDHVAAYEGALAQGGGGAYLRQEGLYHSHIKEWTAARDAGAISGLGGARRSAAASKGSAKGEVERLRAQNVRLAAQLAQTRTALDIMGKAHVLLEMLSESTGTSTPPRRS